MIVYVIEHFIDYESSEILKVFKRKKDALAFYKQKIEFFHENTSHKEEIEELPTGYRTGDEGYIYCELEVE